MLEDADGSQVDEMDVIPNEEMLLVTVLHLVEKNGHGILIHIFSIIVIL